MDPQITPSSAAAGLPDLLKDQHVPANTDATLSDVLLTVRKRKYVILAAVLLGALYGYYKATTQPRMFDAYGRMEIRAGSSNEYRVTSTGLPSADNSSRMATEIAILYSDTLMLNVGKKLDLANNGDFWASKTPVHEDVNDPGVRAAVIGTLQANLHVSVVPKTDIILLNYTCQNPKLAADIVNTVMDAYIHQTFVSHVESTKRLTDFLSGELTDLKREVESSQQRLLEMGRPLGILGFDASHNQITQRLDDLTKAAGTAQIARILAESRYRVLSSAPADTIGTLLEASPDVGQQNTNLANLSNLRMQLATARANYLQSQSYLGPNNPQAKSARAQIDELQSSIDREQKRLVQQVKQELVAAQANEQQTSAALEAAKAEAYKLRDDLVAYTIRQREFDSSRALYENLLQRIRTANVQAGLESKEIDIIDQAVPPVQPTLEPRSSILTLYSAIGLVLGVILAFVLENLDTGLRSVAEIETTTGLPSLALIPRERRSSAETAALTPLQRNIGVLANSKSQFAEAFRSLRTSLLLSSAGHPPVTILMTSATPAEGKTTVSTNLACVLAQRNVRVLLVDADLRRPTVHHRFNLNGRIGLTTVLTGAASVEEAIQRIPEIPNLDILSSGPVPPFPTEMLGSQTMNDLLTQLKTMYSHIVIDSPPLLSVTDAVVLARESDATVLIVRHGKSSKHIVRRARDLLLRAGAPLTGIALNAVDLNSPEYYGYYGYSTYSYAGVDPESWKPKKKSKGDEA